MLRFLKAAQSDKVVCSRLPPCYFFIHEDSPYPIWVVGKMSAQNWIQLKSYSHWNLRAWHEKLLMLILVHFSLSARTSILLPHWAMLGWIRSSGVQIFSTVCISDLPCEAHPPNVSHLDSASRETCEMWSFTHEATQPFPFFHWVVSDIMVITQVSHFFQGLRRDDFEVPQGCWEGTAEGHVWEVCEIWFEQGSDD